MPRTKETDKLTLNHYYTTYQTDYYFTHVNTVLFSKKVYICNEYQLNKKNTMSKKRISIASLAAIIISGSIGFTPFGDINTKALAGDIRYSNGRVIDHDVAVGPDGEPIHTYVCEGDGICGH